MQLHVLFMLVTLLFVYFWPFFVLERLIAVLAMSSSYVGRPSISARRLGLSQITLLFPTSFKFCQLFHMLAYAVTCPLYASYITFRLFLAVFCFRKINSHCLFTFSGSKTLLRATSVLSCVTTLFSRQRFK